MQDVPATDRVPIHRGDHRLGDLADEPVEVLDLELLSDGGRSPLPWATASASRYLFAPIPVGGGPPGRKSPPEVRSEAG
jgi:hypothetical protein